MFRRQRKLGRRWSLEFVQQPQRIGIVEIQAVLQQVLRRCLKGVADHNESRNAGQLHTGFDFSNVNRAHSA